MDSIYSQSLDTLKFSSFFITAPFHIIAKESRLLFMISTLHGPATLTAKHTTRNPALIKQMIHILQLQLVRLGKETVHDRDPQETEDGEDDERSPLDILHGDGRDLDDDEDAHPVDERAQRLALRPDPGRRHLGRVKPGDGEPADAEEDLEEEDHGRGAVRGWLGVTREEDRGEAEAETEAGC